jgi:endogenous inhibitor of DNA gyrase (YacG/DUF329 family)
MELTYYKIGGWLGKKRVWVKRFEENGENPVCSPQMQLIRFNGWEDNEDECEYDTFVEAKNALKHFDIVAKNRLKMDADHYHDFGIFKITIEAI